MLHGGFHSLTLLTFPCSICTVPFTTRTPRKLIWGSSKLHFSRFRYRLCSSSFASIWFMIFRCHAVWSSSVSPCCAAMCIAMLSMYTVMLPSVMRSWNIVFIIVWNVAGELVNLKNMTVGLYSPSFVYGVVVLYQV